MTKAPSNALPPEWAKVQGIEVSPQPDAEAVLSLSKRSVRNLARKFGQMIPDVVAGCLLDHMAFAKSIAMDDDSDPLWVKRATAFLLANGDFELDSSPNSMWCRLDKA